MRREGLSFWSLLCAALALSACAEDPTPQRHYPPRVSHPATSSSSSSPTRFTGGYSNDGLPDKADIPANAAAIPDAVPRYEKRSTLGNPDSYEVYGERYVVLNDFSGFKERGIASWYGKKFHGKNTSSGEPYDMFLMTAAHKTLPIPCYVRVTNLNNQKSAIVRVNDRGPFHTDRIIDLSYVAALKLGIIGEGSAPVEIEALTPPEATSPPPMLTAEAERAATPAPVTQSMTALPPGGGSAPPRAAAAPAAPPAPPATPAARVATIAAITSTSPAAAPASMPPPGIETFWLQAGAFLDPVNAATLRDQLNSMGVSNVEVKLQARGSQLMHRVMIGPFTDLVSRDTVRSRLASVQMASMPVPN